MGLNAEARIASPTTRTVEPTFNQMMNKGDPQMDVEHETAHYRRWSVALTDGQGIPNHVDAPSEQYHSIARMIHAALAKGQHTDPEKSVNVSWYKTGSPRDIQLATKLFGCLGVLDCAWNIYFD